MDSEQIAVPSRVDQILTDILAELEKGTVSVGDVAHQLGAKLKVPHALQMGVFSAIFSSPFDIGFFTFLYATQEQGCYTNRHHVILELFGKTKTLELLLDHLEEAGNYEEKLRWLVALDTRVRELRGMCCALVPTFVPAVKEELFWMSAITVVKEVAELFEIMRLPAGMALPPSAFEQRMTAVNAWQTFVDRVRSAYKD